jgi:uncharacterized protein
VNQRAHPTVRPYALALGVVPRPGVEDQLSFLGPAAAADLATALMLDTLGALSTFPVRHRVVFSDGSGAVTRHTRLPATWRELSQRGETPTERVDAAFQDLLALGAEAMLLVTADGPMLPLAQMFDGMMWLLPKSRVLLGANERSGLYALGAADRLTFLGKSTGEEIGLTTSVDSPASPDAEALITQGAESAGLTVNKLPRSYRIEDRASLARLHGEIKAGMFAPQTRKLLERPDFVGLL